MQGSCCRRLHAHATSRGGPCEKARSDAYASCTICIECVTDQIFNRSRRRRRSSMHTINHAHLHTPARVHISHYYLHYAHTLTRTHKHSNTYTHSHVHIRTHTSTHLGWLLVPEPQESHPNATWLFWRHPYLLQGSPPPRLGLHPQAVRRQPSKVRM
jgi:hypothetical protein